MVLSCLRRTWLSQVLGTRDRLNFQLQSTEKTADRKSTRLNSSHLVISYAVFCLKKKKTSTRTDDAYSCPRLASPLTASATRALCSLLPYSRFFQPSPNAIACSCSASTTSTPPP